MDSSQGDSEDQHANKAGDRSKRKRAAEKSLTTLEKEIDDIDADPKDLQRSKLKRIKAKIDALVHLNSDEEPDINGRTSNEN